MLADSMLRDFSNMPTPSVYKKLQPKLAKFYWPFNVASILLMIPAFVLLALAPSESESIPAEFLVFIVCLFLACLFMVLGMLASYQQESVIRRIPLIGRLHKALVPNSTEWGEALHINFMILVTLFFGGIFIFFIGSF